MRKPLAMRSTDRRAASADAGETSGGLPVGALDDLEAREMPGHGAVLQRHDLVGNAGIDQRLCAYDAARAAAAVDDHHRARRRHQILEAVDQLGARDADGGRNGVGVVLGERAAVEDGDVSAGIDQRLELGGRDPGRAEIVLDNLGERLARHVHAAVDAKAGALPGGDAAVKDRHVRIAEVGHPLGGPLAQASAVVAPHNACLASRHHVVGQHLDAPQRHARGHQDVPLPERLLLAGIEEGDFEPVVQRRLEGPRVDALD